MMAEWAGTASWRKPPPSPSGRGLGEGETLCASQRHMTTASPIPSFPPLTVIPAKAGIHTPPIVTPGTTGALDSGRRRNDDKVVQLSYGVGVRIA